MPRTGSPRFGTNPVFKSCTTIFAGSDTTRFPCRLAFSSMKTLGRRAPVSSAARVTVIRVW